MDQAITVSSLVREVPTLTGLTVDASGEHGSPGSAFEVREEDLGEPAPFAGAVGRGKKLGGVEPEIADGCEEVFGAVPKLPHPPRA